MKKLKKYLPSKKFTLTIGSVILILLVVFLMTYFINKQQKFNEERRGVAVETDLVVGKTLEELISSDADGDGVLDWEEALWGTDKNKKATFEGKSDATYIAEKKKELNIETNLENEQNLTATDVFARQFFSAYTALKASGQADSQIINNFSASLGKQLANPDLENVFNESNIKIASADTKNSQINYYNTLKRIFDTQEALGLGNEINIVSGELVEYNEIGQSKDLTELLTVSTAYKNFAKQVIDTPVPESLKEIHLEIANTAFNTGIAVESMTKTTSDPIIGIAGLNQYQKYSELFVKAVENLDFILDN